MASLWKHPKSKYWTACFTGRDGRQLKRSTKTTDRRKALKFAEQLEEEYHTVRTASQMQKVIQDVYQEVTGAPLEQTSLADYQKRWVANKEAEGCAVASLKFYKHSTERFVEFMGDRAGAPLGAVTQADVERFRNSLNGDLAPETIRHQIKGLRMLFKSAVESQLINGNPAALIKLAKTKRGSKKRKEAFRVEQVAKVLNHCDEEWRGLVLFGFYTGQRLADLQFLKWSDLSPDCGTIRLVSRKTGRPMMIPTAAALREHLRGMARPENPAAFIHPHAASLKTNTLSGKFVDILIAARIRAKPVKDGPRDHTGLSFHSFRHSAVTLLKEAGVPMAVVMELIGHDSEAISANYTHVGEEALAKAAAAFPAL